MYNLTAVIRQMLIPEIHLYLSLKSELILKICLKIFYLNSFLLHSISVSYCYSIILFRIKVICYTEWSTYLILSSVSLTDISSVIKLTVIVLRKLCIYLFCAFVKLLSGNIPILTGASAGWK